jgi:transposase
MAKPLVDDELWALIEPILPAPKPRNFRYPGRKPLPNRAMLNGIIFVLKTGIRWIDLPAELGSWLRQGVPRATARLARGGGVGSLARGAPGRVASRREDRLEPRGD